MVTGLLPKNNGENTYISVFLWRIAWSGKDFLGMEIKKKDGTWTDKREFIPPERKTCEEKTSKEEEETNYDNCWSNIDVTEFIYPEHGGTVYIRLSSNLGNEALSQCLKDRTSVYTKLEISHSRMPTPLPTSAPTPNEAENNNKNQLLSFDVNAQTLGFVAAIVALMTLGLGIFLTFLRKGSKAAEIPIPKTGFIMLFIGGHTVTTAVVLVDIFNSKYKGWGVVIAMMRLLHTVVAILILATIYGSKKLQNLTGLVDFLDRKHMGFNPKIYAAASICCLFDINAFMLLPWRDTDFTRQCFGTAPNMTMFRTVQLTTIFTGMVTIGSQIPYLKGEPWNDNTAFFYANIVMASIKMVVSLLAYFVSSVGLVECKTTQIENEKDVDYTPKNTDDIKLANVYTPKNTDDIELANVWSNNSNPIHEKAMREREKKMKEEMREEMREEIRKEIRKEKEEMRKEQEEREYKMLQQIKQQQEEMLQQMQNFKSL